MLQQLLESGDGRVQRSGAQQSLEKMIERYYGGNQPTQIDLMEGPHPVRTRPETNVPTELPSPDNSGPPTCRTINQNRFQT